MTPRRWATAATYAVLGTLLVWSRFAGLGRGYCCDEIVTVVEYVRRGPDAILVGAYTPNNHQLFSLTGWATTSLVGESEIAVRLWSALPFVAGVLVVTTWLHVRLSALSGLLFLFLATASPLLVDISWQARGYGLAFFAMSAMLVAALEAERTGRTWLVAAFCGAGVLGAWTLPHFTISLLATGIVLALLPELRRATVAGLLVSVVAVAAWYAPHLDDLSASSSQEYGAPIRTLWLVTAPFDWVVVPGLTSLDEEVLRPTLLSLAWSAAFVAVLASSPLLRPRTRGLLVCSGTLATLVVCWIAQFDLVPRFLSFLLVPLLMLLASGAAWILERLTTRPAFARTALVLVVLAVVGVAGVPVLAEAPRIPREAQAEAAGLIRDGAAPSTPVLARMPYPGDLAFHLRRPVRAVGDEEAPATVCLGAAPVVYVDEPWRSPSVALDCLERSGVRHEQLEQYARGDVIHVWFIPAAR
jgi:hypothetical protein